MSDNTFLEPRNFLERVMPFRELKIPVIPLRMQSKDPATQLVPNAVMDATTDVDIIDSWSKNGKTNYNVGAVARYDGYWFLDDDAGTLAETLAHAGITLPLTVRVKTSRGYHYYFKHDDLSRAQKYGTSDNSGVIEIEGFKGEARCNNQYVVGFGSIHPDGPTYELIDDVPIVAAPETLLMWLQKAFAETEERRGRAVKAEKKELDPSKPHLLVKGPPPDDGFKALVEKVGMAPLVRRMNEMDDARFHNPTLKTGADDYCPIPSHGPVRKEDRWQPCFGLVRGSEDVFKCLACGWSGDVIKAIRDIDQLPTMYAAARAICVSEGLNFADYFTEPTVERVEPPSSVQVQNDGVAGTEGQATLKKPTAQQFKEMTLAAYNWETATPFTNIPEVQQEWIIPDLLMKGESTMMTGNFGSFKSYMSYFFADAISQGKEFAKRLAQQHPVLILDRENSAATVSLRRYLVGNLRDATNVRIFGRFTEPRAPEITNVGILEICRTVHPLVIIDSAQDFHPGMKENDQDDMTQFSLEVNAMIDAGAVGVLLLHHVAKADGSDYRGSTALPGGVGGALKVEKKIGTRVLISGFKTRDNENASVELKLIFPSEEAAKNKSGRVTYQVISTGKDPKQAQIERIMDFVAQNPGASKKAVEAHVGGRHEEVRGIIELLVAYKRLDIQGTGSKSGLHVLVKEGETPQYEPAESETLGF